RQGDEEHPDHDRDRPVLGAEGVQRAAEAARRRRHRPGLGSDRHARSPVCWPRMPDGRKIRTNVRTMNTANSDQRDRLLAEAKFSTKPMTNPPSTARVMLPMPPSTAAVNALRPALKPRSWRT